MYQHIMETWHLDPTIDLMLEEATLGKTQTLSKRFSEFLLFFSGSKRGMGKPRIYPHLPTIWGCFYSLGTSIFMVKLSIYPIYPYLCISILFYPIYPYLFISILSFLPILSILSINASVQLPRCRAVSPSPRAGAGSSSSATHLVRTTCLVVVEEWWCWLVGWCWVDMMLVVGWKDVLLFFDWLVWVMLVGNTADLVGFQSRLDWSLMQGIPTKL